MSTTKDGDGELAAAHLVGQVASEQLGRTLGKPVPHDDGSRPNMFDVEFPEAEPPVALEVTSITDEQFVETGSRAHPLAGDLIEVAKRHQTGHWWVQLTKDARLNDLEPWLRKVISGEESLPPRLPSGVMRIDNEPGQPDHVIIVTWSGHGAQSLHPVSPSELRARIAAKEATLRGAPSTHEAHLAIWVHALRSRVLPDPPELPEWLQILWLLWWGDLVCWTTGKRWDFNRDPWA